MSTHKHIHRHMYKYISTNILARLPIHNKLAHTLTSTCPSFKLWKQFLLYQSLVFNALKIVCRSQTARWFRGIVKRLSSPIPPSLPPCLPPCLNPSIHSFSHMFIYVVIIHLSVQPFIWLFILVCIWPHVYSYILYLFVHLTFSCLFTCSFFVSCLYSFRHSFVDFPFSCLRSRWCCKYSKRLIRARPVTQQSAKISGKVDAAERKSV